MLKFISVKHGESQCCEERYTGTACAAGSVKAASNSFVWVNSCISVLSVMYTWMVLFPPGSVVDYQRLKIVVSLLILQMIKLIDLWNVDDREGDGGPRTCEIDPKEDDCWRRLKRFRISWTPPLPRRSQGSFWIYLWSLNYLITNISRWYVVVFYHCTT